MATTLRGLQLTARRCTQNPATFRYLTSSIARQRAFSVAPARWHTPDPRVSEIKAKVLKKLEQSSWNEEAEEDNIAQDFATIEDQIDKAFRDAEPEKMKRDLEKMFEEEDALSHPDPEDGLKARRPRYKNTFMNMGEKFPWEEDDTLPDDDDDLPSLAHAELEQHREIRHYARLAAWEMPLLSKLAKPFVPPTRDMPLRFRYTTYMGEKHPAERKVIVEFSPADMPNLEEIQREKLKKLCGPRYNPETDIVKMSCDMFDTQVQNKRYLGDTIDSLLKESRTGDMFEDIPLDIRHMKPKNIMKPEYPKEWYITEERRAELDRHRQELRLKDEKLAVQGQLVDGIEQIEQGLVKIAAQRKALPEMVMASKPKGKRVTVRR